ncbi:MAG TPA: hypothetical protein VHB69_15235 [Mycobacteriales bacterium]|nr:hypothetical protein [Mycobacteriales bacterium]
MSAPEFVADFDSSTGLVRALAAALHERPFERLGRSRLAGAAVGASRALPEALLTRAFAISGGREAIAPSEVTKVDPEAFARWVVDQYGARRAPAIAVGSSNGAMTHLCAALGIPWLPQTFLVPVRRNADPDDCTGDTHLAAEAAADLLAHQPGLQIHQMHDPNQDRLMVTRLGYFRMKLRSLPQAYRDYINAVLEPDGVVLAIDCTLTWPRTELRERHVYQHGAVGGLRADEYDEGGPRVAAFLAEQGASERSWHFPPTDGCSPEAEWGFEAALRADLDDLATTSGFRRADLEFPAPEAFSPVVADLYREWYASSGAPSRRLLAETFICVEPTWALATRTVPLWLTFGTQPSLEVLRGYLDARSGDFDEALVTLFAHGVRSAGYAPAREWLAATRAQRGRLVGVDASRWPADFAALARYSRDLHRIDPGGRPLPRMPFDFALERLRGLGADHPVRWTEQ